MAPSMNDVMEVVHRYLPKGFNPKIGLILGSGLSSLADQMVHSGSIPYQALPGLQTGSVAGHASLLVPGYFNNVPVICLRGRLHLYEGVDYESIRTLIRVTKYLGCHVFIVTCAAGSLREEAGPGELMMITDHINFHPGNPLVGANDESMGPRFVPMENAYDSELQDSLSMVAQRLHIPLHTGVYLATLGPSFETPAEIRAFKTWGADLVGMSVVPEVIVARHCGLKVAAIAAITNLAAGLSKEKITHEGTLQMGEVAARKLAKLIPEFIRDIHSDMA
jgi:xanthosine phosphorylase